MSVLSQTGGAASPTGSRAAIETLASLIEVAFDGDPKHSILANLNDLPQQDWTALPPGGGRSVADILEHVGWCKWMYQDYAFGSASIPGDQPPLVPANRARSRPPDELLAWLIEGQRCWLDSVRALPDDAELERPRLTHWREPMPTRAIIQIVIAHDLYHAGEINHLRALLHGTDGWASVSSQ